ncbi:Serine/threonine-protein kinase PknB [compost metagenome]
MTQTLANRYHVLGTLGEGGGGKVLLVEDPVRGRRLAMKLLAESLRDPDGILRFKQEFRLMAQLRHPRLVEVFDYGTSETGVPFYTMELIEGEDLPAGPLSELDLKAILVQLAEVLGFIHSRGYLHADVGPANVRRLADGTLKLIDFGLMSPLGQSIGSPRGTPAYMAPESVRGARLDARTDLYSLGAMAFHLATGRPVFDGDDALAVMRAHLDHEPLRPTAFNSALSADAERILLKLLAKDPLGRFSSASELLRALGAQVDDSEPPALLASHFVGRKSELETFTQALTGLHEGRGGQLWVAGPSGVGKSRLLEEFRLRAQLDGAQVLAGVATEQGVPFGPMLEPLRAALNLVEAERLEPFRAPLGAILPEWHREGDLTLDPQKEKTRLQNAVVDVFAMLLASRPIVLLLDDWQWADASSRELLKALSRLTAEFPLLLLGADRTPADDANAAFLTPFEAEEVGEIAGALLGEATLDARFVEQLREATSGLPLAIEGTIRHLAGHGGLKYAAGRWALLPEAASLIAHAQDGTALFEAQLAELSPEARRVAEVAAAMGRPFRLAPLMAVLNADEAAVFAAIAELERGAVLTRKGDRLWFVSGQQAEVVTRLTPDATRRALHTALAVNLLMEGVAEDDLESLNDLARHALSGDRPEVGIAPALSAARKNLSLFALEAARRLLEAVLPHLKDRADRLAAKQMLGDVARFSSELDEAERLYVEALELSPDPVTAGVIRTNYAVCAQIRSNYAEALERLAEARKTLEEEPSEWLRCITFQARNHYFKGETDQAIAVCEEALPRARSAGHPQRLSGVLGFLGMLYALAANRPHDGVELLVEALEVSEPLGDKVGLNDTLNLLGNAKLAAGDILGAEAAFARTLTLSRETGARGELVAAHINLALVAHDRGRAETAVMEAERAGEEAAAIGNSVYRGIALVALAAAKAASTELDPALDLLDEVAQQLEQDPNAYLKTMWRSFGSEVQLHAGDLLEACLWAELALEEGKKSGTTEFDERASLVLAEALLRLGETDSARDALKGLDVPQARFLLAAIALKQGRLNEADRLGAEVLVEATERHAERLLVRTRLLLAEVAFSRADVSGARIHFEDAAELARDCGATLLECHANFGLAACAGRNPEGYALLRKVRMTLGTLLERLSIKASENLLSLEEPWRIQQGDFDALRHAEEAPGKGVSERRYLESLQRERELQAELEALGASKRRLEILNRFTSETQAITDYELLLERMVALTASLLDADSGLMLLPDERDELQIRSTYNLEPSKALAFSRSIAESSFRSGTTTFIADALGGSDFSTQRSVMDLQIRAALSVPLRLRDRVLGVIYVDRQTVHHGFSEEDRRLVEAIALQAAQSLDNARLLAETRTKARQMEMLNQLSRSVSTSLVLSEVLSKIGQAALELTGADRAMILMRGEVGLIPKVAYDHSGALDPETVTFSQTVGHQVLATGEPFCDLDTQANAELQAQRSIMALDLRTILCVPLLTRDQAMGVLYVDSKQVVGAFGSQDLDLLTAIANQASIAITNAQLYERATVDGLTRLYVRSFFEQRLTQEVSRALRYGEQVSVLMMDVDHFKKFNDTYGHAVGDLVLKLVADVIRQTIRQEIDIPARFGGEEMLVLMPDTGVEGAMVLAERVRAAIEAAGLPHDGSILQVKVSVGVSTAPHHGKTTADLIEAADAALYYSKRNGRNQVTLFRPGMTADAKTK